MKTNLPIQIPASILLTWLAFASSSTGQSLFGPNLIVNGDAEAGTGSSTGDQVVPIPGWAAEGGLTVVQYSAMGVTGGYAGMGDPGPHDRGTNFFAGGPTNSYSRATQTIDLTSAAASIDTNGVNYALLGFLGGYEVQNDNAMLTVIFLSSSNTPLSTNSIGPVLASDRANHTGLLLRSTNGPVPVGTRSAKVILEMTRLEGSYNDGYADNLSLTLSTGSGVQQPILAIYPDVEVTWLSQATRYYQVQWAPTLASNAWSNLGAPLLGDGSTLSVYDRTAGIDQRFYRVLLLP